MIEPSEKDMLERVKKLDRSARRRVFKKLKKQYPNMTFAQFNEEIAKMKDE